MINELTKDQQAGLVKYVAEWNAVGRSTAPIDEAMTKKVLTSFYAALKRPAPQFLIYDSPLAVCVQGAARFPGITANEILAARYAQRWWVGWIAFYRFGEKIGVKYKAADSSRLAEWDALSRACHWFFPFENFCLLSRAPTALHVDAAGRLHSPTGYAIAYADGYGFCSWHGIRLTGDQVDIVLNPERLSMARIDGERNAEIRRA